eukprot:Skav205924  [mRNA]  locus=scaffold123:931766:940646:+ [translate_table: standard]
MKDNPVTMHIKQWFLLVIVAVASQHQFDFADLTSALPEDGLDVWTPEEASASVYANICTYAPLKEFGSGERPALASASSSEAQAALSRLSEVMSDLADRVGDGSVAGQAHELALTRTAENWRRAARLLGGQQARRELAGGSSGVTTSIATCTSECDSFFDYLDVDKTGSLDFQVVADVLGSYIKPGYRHPDMAPGSIRRQAPEATYQVKGPGAVAAPGTIVTEIGGAEVDILQLISPAC